MLAAVGYHYVRPRFDEPHEGIYGLTPSALKAQLTRLSSLGTFVSAAQVREAVRGSKALPDRAILITFDDGLREQVEHALPVLQQLNIPAVFFVGTHPISAHVVAGAHKVHLMRSRMPPQEFARLIDRQAEVQGIRLAVDMHDELASQYPYDSMEIARLKYLLNSALPTADAERLIDACFADVFPKREAAMSEQLYMDTDQLRTLASLGFLGSHGHGHLPLGLLHEAEVARQIRLSVSHLVQWTGTVPFAMSYPYGSSRACAPFIGPICEAEGIEFAFTMDRRTNHDFNRPMFLGRFDTKDVPVEEVAAGRLLFGHSPAQLATPR